MSQSRDRKRKPGRKGSSQPQASGHRTGGSTSKARQKPQKSHRSGGGGRNGDRNREKESGGKARKLPAAAEGLPRHVVESLLRVTPAARQNAALAALSAAAEAFSEGQYHVAVRKAEHAKDLSSRDATIREILGLSAYRVGDWQKALQELRTFRRLSGETTHMPVEMDALRALDRPDDVAVVWQEFRKLGGGPAVKKEARVVYASHLIDIGDLEGASELAGSPKKSADPWPEDLRLWYVAARIAALRGEKEKARRFAEDVVLADPSFPGLDELDRLIDAS
ncbi:MAG: hypothetical protein QNJ77_07825 [Acidimicrobiia bacterium]|nr:hypothetical protein [Acidimicrobiia bacterium]